MTDELQAEPPVLDVAPDPSMLKAAIAAVRAAGALAEPAAWNEPIVRSRIDAMQGRLEHPPAFLFDDARAGPEDRAILVREVAPAADVWLIGDLHGDLLSLEVALRYIATQAPDANVIFLGDLFDAGPHGAAVVLRVWQRLLEAPK